MKWKITGASARGSSHVRSGRPNQDAFEYFTGTKAVAADDANQPHAVRALLAVSDGHGGARHFRSEMGSRLAGHISVSVLPDMVAAQLESHPSATLSDEIIPGLLRKLVDDWRAAALSDLENNPFTPAELSTLEVSDGAESRASVEADPVIAYGATLLLTIVTDACVLYAQLGDGDILAVSSTGETYRPLPADDRLVGNQTTSLCQPEAWKEFRWVLAEDPSNVAAVLVSTDGYSNSFRSDRDFLKIGADYVRIIKEDGLSSLGEDLPEILTEASAKGSGDDITLGILISDAVYSVPAPLAAEYAPAPTTQSAILARPRNTPVREVPAEPVAPISVAPPALPSPPPVEPTTSAPSAPSKTLSAQKMRVVAAVAVILGATFLLQHYGRLPGMRAARTPNPPATAQPGVAAAPPAETKPKIVNPPPEGEVWVVEAQLAKTGHKTIALPLIPEEMISAKSLLGIVGSTEVAAKAATNEEDGDHDYAKVMLDGHGRLVLLNLSSDPWTVQMPDKEKVEPPIGTGAGVVLADAVKITFRSGAQGRISLGQAPAKVEAQ